MNFLKLLVNVFFWIAMGSFVLIGTRAVQTAKFLTMWESVVAVVALMALALSIIVSIIVCTIQSVEWYRRREGRKSLIRRLEQPELGFYEPDHHSGVRRR